MALSYSLDWFRDLLLTCDPNLTKYRGIGSELCTVWRPQSPLTIDQDNAQHIYGWQVEVERCTKDDDDSIVALLLEALLGCERAEVSYTDAYDPTDGVHTHLFVCEVT